VCSRERYVQDVGREMYVQDVGRNETVWCVAGRGTCRMCLSASGRTVPESHVRNQPLRHRFGLGHD
jgi:hypothetical protein